MQMKSCFFRHLQHVNISGAVKENDKSINLKTKVGNEIELLILWLSINAQSGHVCKVTLTWETF